MSMYGDYYANYPQDAPIQWREPQRNYWAPSSNSPPPPPVPLLAITVIIIFFLCMSALFGFYNEESNQSRSEFSLYLILIALFLVLLYVAWHMFWDSFIIGTRPSNWYGPQVSQVVDGVSGGGGGLSVMMAAAFLALALALVFYNPVLAVPVALAGAVNLLATVL